MAVHFILPLCLLPVTRMSRQWQIHNLRANTMTHRRSTQTVLSFASSTRMANPSCRPPLQPLRPYSDSHRGSRSPNFWILFHHLVLYQFLCPACTTALKHDKIHFCPTPHPPSPPPPFYCPPVSSQSEECQDNTHSTIASEVAELVQYKQVARTYYKNAT